MKKNMKVDVLVGAESVYGLEAVYDLLIQRGNDNENRKEKMHKMRHNKVNQ